MNNLNTSSIEKIHENLEEETLVVNSTPVEHFPDPAARATPKKLGENEPVEVLDIPEDIPSSRPGAPSVSKS